MSARKGNQPHQPFQLFTQIINMTLLGVLILSCVFAINKFKLSHYFPIKNVRVYGVNRTEHQDVQDLLLPLVDHGFFNVNVELVRDRLLQLPWVSNIFVRRQWPDTIDVTVIEKNAVANWNLQSLLSENGELFSPDRQSYPTTLPSLNGPDGKQIIMLSYLNEINRLLLPLHAKIAYLELTPYFSWKLTLDNGITLQLGHKDILTR